MPQSLQKNLRLAARHMSAGRLREAAGVYRQILHRDPHYPAALHGLGVLAFRANRIDAAEKLLLRALAADPNLACAHDDVGSVRLLRGNTDDAIEQFQIAISADPKFVPAYLHLAETLTRLGQLERALSAYQRAAALSLAGWRRRTPGIDLPAGQATDPPLQPPIFTTPPNGEPAPPAVQPASPQFETTAPAATPVHLAESPEQVSEHVPAEAAFPPRAVAIAERGVPVMQPPPMVWTTSVSASAAPAMPMPAQETPRLPAGDIDAVAPTSVVVAALPAGPQSREETAQHTGWLTHLNTDGPKRDAADDDPLAPNWEAMLAVEEPDPTMPVVEAEVGDPRLDAPWAAARRRIAAVRTAPPVNRKPAPIQPGLAIRPVALQTTPDAAPVASPVLAPAAAARSIAVPSAADISIAKPVVPTSVVVAPDAASTATASPVEFTSATVTPSAIAPADPNHLAVSTFPITPALPPHEDPLIATRLLAKQLRRSRRAPADIAKQAVDLYKQGASHLKERRVEDAIGVLEQLVELHPGSAKAHRDLGAAYLRVDRLDDAHAQLIKALELRPRFGDAYASLGDVYHLQGKVDEAIACYRRALSLKPGAAKIHSNLLLTLNYHRKIDNKTLFAEHQRWALQHAAPLEATLRPHDNAINPDRQLRIGYISPDFRRHSVNYFAEPILSRHDRSAFHLTCYSDVMRPDAETERIARMCEQWRDITGMSDEDVAALVREDKIDILVDLAGHTGGNRLLVFARKPAPVQVTYLGYPNTTGMRVMDFRITDAAADPQGQSEQFHSEQLVRLQNFLCYSPPPEAPEPVAPPIVKNGYVTFGCFNILSKVTPDAMSLWAKIMLVLPNSRLVMKDRIGSFASAARRRYVQDIFAYHRISPDRIELLEKESEFAAHLRAYERVDVMLDPFPYNGTTTTCESLWMGVPVIALAGNRHAARVGVSVLTAAGLPEFIAPNLEAYARTAVVLARDPARLAILRQTLRAKLRSSTLLDGKRLTSALEHRYRMMWHRWCKLRQEALPPAAESMSLSDE